jgi:hypothetical protein
VITVHAHNKPVVSINNITVGSSIYVDLNVTVDFLSKFGQERNGIPRTTWRFINDTTGSTETVVTDSTTINFAPSYNGDYHLEMIVSDGGLSTSYIWYIGQYSGGIPPLGPINDIQ